MHGEMEFSGAQRKRPGRTRALVVEGGGRSSGGHASAPPCGHSRRAEAGRRWPSARWRERHRRRVVDVPEHVAGFHGREEIVAAKVLARRVDLVDGHCNAVDEGNTLGICRARQILVRAQDDLGGHVLLRQPAAGTWRRSGPCTSCSRTTASASSSASAPRPRA